MGEQVRLGAAHEVFAGHGRGAWILDSPPYSGGKKCRFRGSSRSTRIGLRRSSGSAVETGEDEQAGLSMPSIPPGPPRTIGEDAVPHCTRHRREKEQASVWWGAACLLPTASGSPLLPLQPPPSPASTRANLDEAIVLYEDGIAGQVPVDDGGVAGV